jgi:hypothetical protein
MKTRTKLIRRLFINNLFNDTLSYSNYISLNVRLSVNNVLETMSEEAVVAKLEVLFYYVETGAYCDTDPSRHLFSGPKYEAQTYRIQSSSTA